jgi:hypothetical protein
MSLAARVFERFVALYGAQKFKVMFEHDDNAIMPAKEAWENFLQSVKPDVLRKVMETLPHQKREWPPNLSEFIGMCKDFDRVEQREFVALRQKHEPTDKGKIALANLKAMLSKEKP